LAEVDLAKARQRLMAGLGNAQARMLVQFTDIDQDGAVIDQRLGLGGGDAGKRDG
jgi:hypothetical protein